MPYKNILYADDDPNDVLMFKMALKRATLPYTLATVEDGQQAMEWLTGKGAYADRQQFPLPELLILDLKMPKMNGFEVLEWVRSQTGLKTLPVIILSSSDDPGDVKRAYSLGATTYFVKTATFQEVTHYLRSSK